MTRRAVALVLTCEHASNVVPPRWRSVLPNTHPVLRTHRGWDPGAGEMARRAARTLDAPLVCAGWTRLLVDPNRSPGNARALSEFTRNLDAEAQRRLWDTLHAPHWRKVRAVVDGARAGGRRCLHVGVHSFTPVRNGRRRSTDVGILYDPHRPAELALALTWQAALQDALPDLRVHRNRPYLGSSDGLTTALRRALPASGYLGIELELSQRLIRAGGRRWHRVQQACIDTLRAVST